MSQVRSQVRKFVVAAAVLTAGLMGPLQAPLHAGWVQPTILPAPLITLNHPLPHVQARLAAGQRLKIVALGSSSTQGVGASSPANCYPARLNALLRTRYPDVDVVVKNHGVGGEDAEEMLARLDRVIAEKPDLIIWQLGTNAVLNGVDRAEQERLMRIGLARLLASDADVVLIDPQYVPQTADKPGTAVMVELIDSLARQYGVGVFHRFAIMRHWSRVQHIPFRTFTARDGLHMNDWSYAQFARLLADAIGDASATRIHTARVRPASRPHSKMI